MEKNKDDDIENLKDEDNNVHSSIKEKKSDTQYHNLNQEKKSAKPNDVE